MNRRYFVAESEPSQQNWFKQLWAAQWDRERRQPLKLALFVASIGLSIASAGTTGMGFLQFTPPWFLPLSVLMTFGVQTLLFVVSWRLGATLLERRSLGQFCKQQIPLWLVFFIAAVVSIFFSFAFLFDEIYDRGSREIANLTAVQSNVETILGRLKEDIEKEQTERILELVDSDKYATWSKNVEKVTGLAEEAKDQLLRLENERNEKLAEELAANTMLLETAQQTKEQLKEQMAQLKLDMQDLNAQLIDTKTEIAPINKALNNLVADEEELTRRMDKEERSGGGTGVPSPRGRGPKWRGLRDQREQVKAQKNDQKFRLDPLINKRNRLESEWVKKETQLTHITEALSRAVGKEGKAKRATETIGRERENQTAQSQPFNVDSALLAMREGLSQFSSTYEYKRFDDAANACEQIVDQINQNKILRERFNAPGAPLVCNRQGLENLIKPINDMAKIVPAFTKSCQPNTARDNRYLQMVGGGGKAPQAEVGAIANATASGTPAPAIGAKLDLEAVMKMERTLQLNGALKLASDCITLSGLPTTATQDYRETIDSLMRQRRDNVSLFTQALNAIFADREPLAILAAGIAVSLDFLILLCSLVGATSVQLFLDKTNRPIRSSAQSDQDIGHMVGIQLAIDPDVDDQRVINIKTFLQNAHDDDSRKNEGYDTIVDLDRFADDPITQLRLRAILATLVRHDRAMRLPGDNVYYVKAGQIDMLQRELKYANNNYQPNGTISTSGYGRPPATADPSVRWPGTFASTPVVPDNHQYERIPQLALDRPVVSRSSSSAGSESDLEVSGPAEVELGDYHDEAGGDVDQRNQPDNEHDRQRRPSRKDPVSED